MDVSRLLASRTSLFLRTSGSRVLGSSADRLKFLLEKNPVNSRKVPR